MDLSDLEIKVLKALSDQEIKVEDLAKILNLDYFEVLRTVGFLKLKGLAEVREEEIEEVKLGELGEKYLKIGLPERRLLNILKEKKEVPIDKLKDLFSEDELKISVGMLKKKGAIEVDRGVIKYVKDVEIPEEDILRKVAEGRASKEEVKHLLKRKKLVKIIKRKIFYAKITDKGKEIREDVKEEKLIIKYNKEVFERKLWKKYKFKEFEINVPVKPAKIGKKNPYLEFLDNIRRELISMGFEEMEDYTMFISHFWDMDALFLPQDHPAGEMSFMDTFYLKNIEEFEDFPKELEEKVAKTHLKYFGIWDEKLARRPLLISHVTAISAKTLTKVKIPGKYFAIEKVFRYDTIDKTHFIEFNQLEGIVLDENMTFRDLLGILKELIVNVVGAEDVKFYPAYFPFTEPSVEAYAKHPTLGWMEVGGAGIFREELLEQFGINVPVIAWGLGIDRLAMINLGIDDIRDLHSRRLSKLLE